MKRYRPSLFLGLALCVTCFGVAFAGQRQQRTEESPMDAMSIEEMRSYQSYFYAPGGRDPLTMRQPTSAELGSGEGPVRQAPTEAEMRMKLEQAITTLTSLLQTQKYEDAIKVGEEIIHTIDNEWPAIKPDTPDLLAMVDEIRSYHRMAVTLKRNQDIKNEFIALLLKVNGVVWSPTDAKAVVNGRVYSAGEVMIAERKQGDLRIEIIEEHGVVFQFKGIRFRLPVEVYAPPLPLGGL